MNRVDSKAINPLRALYGCGQSVWLDYIRRHLLTSGELQRLMDEDGLRGVTSNPAIFEKAITGSSDYTSALRDLEARNLDAKASYEALAIRDIQDAADILRPLYHASDRRDGYVSLEVSPLLARDARGTLDEARRLWAVVARENVMIKVPATTQGIAAVRELIGAGINVNVTLLFSKTVYEQVAEAYLCGLQKRATEGGDLSKVASVASFFISRIDSALDAMLATRIKSASDTREAALLKGLVGQVAIANAKLTYRYYQELFGSARWRKLAELGAQTQRVLWASTSTKNPAYRDVIYVEELIGRDTVNTIPPATFDAFRDHGQVRPSLTEDVEGAYDTMETLGRVGISMGEVTDRLLEEGLALFSQSFEKLLKAVAREGGAAAGRGINRQTSSISGSLAAAVDASLKDWAAAGKVRSLWARDASLWTGTDEGNWLGWLGIADDQLAHLQHLTSIAEEVRRERFSHVLLLGMGGSSLCPEVLKMSFGQLEGYPELHVLDSTDPAQLKAFEAKVDLSRTLCIVSSKSGGTLEPNILKEYFFERIQQAVGVGEAGNRFIAITDPGSKMQQVAAADRFRHVFPGLASIGGRYSALSNFGMVPAAIMGIDVARFLDRTEQMVRACASCVPVAENPGVLLGTILGAAAVQGRDKLTIIASPGIRDLGAWLEQLVAESTGKGGKGLIPVDRESIGAPDVYGDDRVFVYVRLEGSADPTQDTGIAALERAGQPVVRIALADVYDLGQEFFRWQIATAVAGSIIGINPFNQPDVEVSKVATRTLTAEYERTGGFSTEFPFFEQSGVKLFADEGNAAVLQRNVGRDPTLAQYLKAHFGRLVAGDYFALLAYVHMNATHEQRLQALRHAVRDNMRVATCLGFGPRFLHSTGQGYKGGPASGVFLQITCDDATDVPVPGRKYTFGVVKAAQARGDFQVLAERNRRALRVHLSSDLPAGLSVLDAAVREALR
ncbi:MAG TPA: bifunctional transaldolase/phosoglucose isomerase [Steroidobacteraceae bacterium]|nr:bifunctional transaldolase/phosoglucose isomerase [Steroidobacteraceae bacterium]